MNDIVKDGERRIEKHRKGFFQSLLGHFATKDFWRDWLALVLREAISSFISVLGGSLIYSVQKRVTNDSNLIKKIVDSSVAPAGTPPSQASPSSVFSSGYQPQSSYKPTYTQAPQGSPPSYPGFG